MEDVQDDVLLNGEQRDTKQRHHQQLNGTDLPQNGSVGDQTSRHTEVCIDQAEHRGHKVTNSIKSADNKINRVTRIRIARSFTFLFVRLFF